MGFTYRSIAQIPDPLQLSLWVGARETGGKALEVFLVLKEEDLDVVHYKSEIWKNCMGVFLVVWNNASDLLLEGEGWHLRVFLGELCLF